MDKKNIDKSSVSDTIKVDRQLLIDVLRAIKNAEKKLQMQLR